MDRKAWFSAAFFTLTIAIAAAILAGGASGRFRWGEPETPKAQCEALAIEPDSIGKAPAGPAPYKERVASAIIREPQNTWSNLAFVFAGALVWFNDRRIFPRLFGIALVALGVASGLYHASLAPAWRTVDVAAMGWVSFALCCYACNVMMRGTIRPASETLGRDILIGLVGGVAAVSAAYWRNEVHIGGVKPFGTTYTTVAGIAVIFLLAVVGLVRSTRARPAVRVPVGRLAILALVVAIAAFCQINDRAGHCLCAPDGLIQGHAVWHLLMAVAAAMAYDLFARIEGGSGL